jgi:N-acetylglucosamine kinase-like BadF-type ATPase
LHYVIGIDGGGTKTEAVVMATDGRQLTAIAGGASNPHAVGYEAAFRHLSEIFLQIWQMPDLKREACTAIALGLAGVSTDEEKKRFMDYLLNFLEQNRVTATVRLSHDAEIGLMATIGKQEGVVAISGTGSIVYGMTAEGESLRVGGWGHLLGDEGSGYSIGLQTLKAVMRSHDGVYPPTLMTNMIKEKYCFLSITELKSFIYAPTIQKIDIAAFARICVDAAEIEDGIAEHILDRSAMKLASQTFTLVGKKEAFATGDLVVSGSLFLQSPFYYKAYERYILGVLPDIRIHRAKRTPAYGAALLALESGHTPSKEPTT